MDKQYRRVLSIISKYFYRPKKYASVSETREVKLNCLLGVKVRKKKKYQTLWEFLQTQEKERMFVFNYFIN
jgi:hypothetical protein